MSLNIPSDSKRQRTALLAAATLAAVVLTGSGHSHSDLPPDRPSEAQTKELAKLIDGADRIVVKQVPKAGVEVLFESDRRIDLDELKASMKVVTADEPSRCGCAGSPAIYLYSGDKQVGLITNQHGKMIRFGRWEWDAPLADGSLLLDWFAKRKIAGPKEERAREERILERFGAAHERWIEAMPKTLQPLWKAALKESRWFKDGELREALAKDIPDRDERIRALFAWFGSGMGQWSGYPAYEMFAEELILEYPTKELVAALGGQKLDSAQLEGAARLFERYPYSDERSKDLVLLPADLKRQLRVHCLASPEAYKKKLAGTIFKAD